MSEILEYFEPAYQLGMTATPLRDENRDTYLYFGNPIYTYSLKQIADVLSISIKTAEKHRQELMDKLGIHDTASLTRYAVAQGMVEAGRPPGSLTQTGGV